MSDSPKRKTQSFTITRNPVDKRAVKSALSIPGTSHLVNSIAKDHESLESDHFRLQQEFLNKESKFEDMEKKLETLQTQLIDQSTENKAMAHRLSRESDVEHELQEKLRSYALSAKKMGSEMTGLQDYVEALRQEVVRLKEENENRSKNSPADCKDDPEDAIHEIKFNRLKTQFEHLQCQYVKKEKQCEDLTARMKNCLTQCDNISREKATNEALKKRADDLLKEIDGNKVFILELQEQVDTYREKYMKGKFEQ